MITMFTKYQEVSIDEMAEVYNKHYKALYSFDKFIENFKTLLHLRIV
jgi:hypothetical protein